MNINSIEYLKKLSKKEEHIGPIVKNVILWGVGGFDLAISKNAQYYIHLLEKTNIKIVCLVDRYLSDIKYNDYKIISEDEFKKDYKTYQDTAIVPIGRTLQDDKSVFDKIVRTIINKFQLKDAKILHPVFLANYLPLNYSGMIHEIGYGGSGNTVLRSIIQSILNLKKEKLVLGKDEQFFAKLAKEHKSLINNTLEAAFLFYDIEYINSGIRRPSDTSLVFYTKDSFIRIENLKTRYDIVQNFTATHAFLFDNLIDDLVEKKFFILNPIRNPLEILVSNAFTIPFDLVQNNIIQNEKGQSSLKETLAKTRLSNKKWFMNNAQYIKLYFQMQLKNRSKVHQVHYESLLDSPQETISMIAKYLKTDLSENQIKEIWNRVGLKPLSPLGKTHFNKPSNEKYKIHLGCEHMEILKELEFDKLLIDSGYEDIQLESEISSPFKEYEPVPDNELQILTLEDTFNIPFTHSDYSDENILTQEIDNLQITSNNQIFIDQFNKIYSNNYVYSIINSIKI